MSLCIIRIHFCEQFNEWSHFLRVTALWQERVYSQMSVGNATSEPINVNILTCQKPLIQEQTVFMQCSVVVKHTKECYFPLFFPTRKLCTGVYQYHNFIKCEIEVIMGVSSH